MTNPTCHMMAATVVIVLLSVPAQTKLVYVEENLPLPGKVSPPGSPWPLPLVWESEAQQVTLDPNTFTIISNLKGCDVIDAAIHRYEHLTLISRPPSFHNKESCQESLQERQSLADPGPEPGLPVLLTLNMSISSSCDSRPSLSQDESYTLTVEMNNGSAVASLESTSVWGALRGLETFSQLVYIQEPNNFYRLNLTSVNDKPRFAHRGLLLDTARHFIPKHVLLQVLDSMSWNKLNVFHWHIVDDQSFPYESKLFKNLTEFGAYTPRHVYTQDDVDDIVQYAQLRGIRVIPEFDTPGHAQGFGKAFPHLLTPCYGDGRTPGTPNFPYHAAYENFDPTNNAVYEFMRSFLVDVKATFTDDYIHLGLDEVFLPCWSGSPVVRAFMEKNNYTDPREVEKHYVKEILRLAKDTSIQWITWQDPAERGIQMENNSIVQIWKDVSLSPTKMKGWREYVQDLTEKGYKVILSSCWYINFITYGQDWKNFYNCDPTDFAGTTEQKQLVLGGEAAMWGEYVDATNLMPRLWPRASAAAERLWSMPLDQAPSADDAASRLDQHRCRMLRRGISAQPILNGFCGEWEVPLPEHAPCMSTVPPIPLTTTTETTKSSSTTPKTPISSTTATPPSVTKNNEIEMENINKTTKQDVSTATAVGGPLDPDIDQVDEPSENVSTSPPSSSTMKSTTITTSTTTTTIPTTIETENNVSPSNDVVVSTIGPMSDSGSSISDTNTVSVAPIESLEVLITTLKYIESKEESNDVEEQSDSTVST